MSFLGPKIDAPAPPPPPPTPPIYASDSVQAAGAAARARAAAAAGEYGGETIKTGPAGSTPTNTGQKALLGQ